MPRRWRIAAGSLLLCLGVLATAACAGQRHPIARPELLVVPLEDRPEWVGELRLDGAWSLSANLDGFGGISATRLAGDRLLLLSDRSQLFALPWPLPPGDRPSRLPLLQQRSLLDLRGRSLDAEALEVEPDGRLLVADEGSGRILMFAAGRPQAATLHLPELVAPDGDNAGIEALTRLPGGGLLALAEGETADTGEHAAVRRSGKARLGLRYRPAPGFRPTDLAAAPPWLFVLERRLSLLGAWQTRLVAVTLAELPEESGGVIEGRELAVISGARLGENYEAVAAAIEPGGYRLLVLSDDNFTGLQRTLLLSLVWQPGPAPVAKHRDAS